MPTLPPADDLRDSDADYFATLSRKYQTEFSATERGRRLAAQLDADPRVAALEGQLVSCGPGGTDFHRFTLGAWYMWFVRQVGEERAQAAMNDYLEAERIEVLATRWVLGVTTTSVIDLGNGVSLVPVEAMPESIETELIKQARDRFDPFLPILPQTALTQRLQVSKVFHSEQKFPIDRPELLQAGARLEKMVLLLNALDGIQAEPSLSTAYQEAHVPCGPLAGSSSSRPHFDVTTRRNVPIRHFPRDEYERLYQAYQRRNEAERNRLDLILARLGQAKRRTHAADKILDLGVVLEMLLLRVNPGRDQLALTFRLRGSWLLGESSQERKTLFRQFKDLYGLRSQVAHGGTLEHPGAAMQRAPEYETLACRVLRRLVLQGEPDWDNLVLGVTG